MLRIIPSDENKPAGSQVLRELVDQLPQARGTLYLGYPVFGSPEGARQIDALLVSPDLGLVSFDLHEAHELGDYVDRQDDLANKIESRLREHKLLMKGRNLAIKNRTATVAPASPAAVEEDAEHKVFSGAEAVANWLRETAEPLDSHVFETLVSAIQNLGGLRAQPTPRKIENPKSRGAKLRSLEDKIATMDASQDKAVLQTFEGVQRIRGLAGSGKTVVLARKAALLHSRHPDWNIAITFETWSLKSQFERLIRQFMANQRLGEPNFEKLHVFSCWGSPQRPGLYSVYCRVNSAPYHDVTSAKARFSAEKTLLEGVSKEARKNTPNPQPFYHAILVDEAQDLSPAFLLLCYDLLHPPKRLVYAYDELQSLDDSSMPSPEEIFGSNSDGIPRVTMAEDQDFILERCYRNSGPVLTTAHALGFGIYRKRGLVQIFNDKDLWKEIGYTTLNEGGIADGKDCILTRTPETSPNFLEMDESPEQLIQTHVFSNSEEQDAWLISQIETNLKKDELLPNDILVINPDPFTTKRNTGNVRARLFEKGIRTILAGVDASAEVFFDGTSIMFSGIRRARGNEASMVYIINAHECFEAHSFELARVRNRLFTAITRSKAWVHIAGHGASMKELAVEIAKVHSEKYRLHFKYPDEAARAKLRRLNKDRRRTSRRLAKQVEQAIMEGELDFEELEALLRDKRKLK